MAIVPALLLGGCADTVSDNRPLRRFGDLIRGYDRTLTEDEKKRVISELQKDKERQQQQIGQGDIDEKPPETPR